MEYELHPLCTLYPRMQLAEFEQLKQDIRVNGLQQAIVLKDGMILDGGNRYQACLELGITPKFVQFEGENAATFVQSMNLHRRHLTPGQQAVIVAASQDWERAQTASRPRKECNVAPLVTAETRANQSGASIRTQKSADKLARANPDLALKVAHGEISLPKALKQLEPEKPAAKPVYSEDNPGPAPDAVSTSAYVLAVRAKASIREIHSKDEYALGALDSIQKALDQRRKELTA